MVMSGEDQALRDRAVARMKETLQGISARAGREESVNVRRAALNAAERGHVEEMAEVLHELVEGPYTAKSREVRVKARQALAVYIKAFKGPEVTI